jgi:hemoglobin-like flavoprotein
MNFQENKYILEDIKYKLSNIYSNHNSTSIKNEKYINFKESLLSMISIIESFKETIIGIELFDNHDSSFNENITEFINQLYEYTAAMKIILT